MLGPAIKYLTIVLLRCYNMKPHKYTIILVFGVRCLVPADAIYRRGMVYD